MAIAVAHPNVALVKYWGKEPGLERENVPATPSLSIALKALSTRTEVSVAAQEQLRINGEAVRDAKLERFIGTMRKAWDLPPLAVTTCNDFPTGAGLASSASGFAALVTAIDGEFGLGLSESQRSVWARRGSASAARSIAGGFATLEEREGEWSAKTILAKENWPLEMVVAVTSKETKATSSTTGMEWSRNTSPFYPVWVQSTLDDFREAQRAVAARDFDALGQISEHSCLKMHALMLSTKPALVYWNEATLTALRTIKELRDAGTPVFFTIDAGPQLKAICRSGFGAEVEATLARLPGVLSLWRSGVGDGARLLDANGADNG